jgi:anti-sigma B factor antagonist
LEIDIRSLENSITIVSVGADKTNKNVLNGNVELDIQNQSKFIETLNTLFDNGNIKLIIDMSNIIYIDSSGLWAIFEGHKKAVERNGNLVMLNPGEDVRRVLDITKISSKIHIFETDLEALNFFNSQSQS